MMSSCQYGPESFQQLVESVKVKVGPAQDQRGVDNKLPGECRSKEHNEPLRNSVFKEMQMFFKPLLMCVLKV